MTTIKVREEYVNRGRRRVAPGVTIAFLAAMLAGCASQPSIAPTTDVTLHDVQEAVVHTVQETVTQSYHDIGSEQRALDEHRADAQSAIIACLAIIFVGGWIVALFMPSFNMSARWTAMGIGFGAVMILSGVAGLIVRFVL